MEDSGEYFELTSEQYIDKLMPFNETEDLIDEAINLQTTIKMDKVILSERRNKKKDRIVVLSYANHVFDLIENAWNKQLFDYDLNVDDIQCVW
jgi:3-dehydroquinate dehydratase